jgi:metal-sulfur cluster biosynthetic enzyme
VSTALVAHQVLAALRGVMDPEIPIDVVELGLIYDVRVRGDQVEVDMTLTSMGCPCHDLIVDDVRTAAEGVPGVQHAEVTVVWDPPWDRSRLGVEGVRYLPIVGIGV